MPEMGGIEATQLIRQLQIKQPIIVAVTADVFVKIEPCGFDDYVLKPLDKNKFCKLLEKYSEPSAICSQ